jgi:hypothetical protein
MKKFIIILLATYVLIVPIIGGEEQNNKIIKFPSLIIFKSLSLCTNFVLQHIFEASPHLRGVPIPPPVLLKIGEHCACIMDKIRKDFTYDEYVANVKAKNGSTWLEMVWRAHGLKCSAAGYDLNLSEPPKSKTTKESLEEELPKTEKQDNSPGTLFQG